MNLLQFKSPADRSVYINPRTSCRSVASRAMSASPGHPDWFHAWWQWIEARGFQIWQYQKPTWTPKGMYLAVGPAGHPDGDHCVVMRAGELYHDPAGPMAVGLQSIDFIVLLLPLDPAAALFLSGRGV
ncbi:MAG: hypothetical protein KIT02_02880 [Devosia sp.]|uniref:hypothetical protein n=1 Tax=Devosia sp. TaxID=1871048 RepID=UPI0024C96EAF|nr:hypothetical protein [Devosia sp.]UYO00191.1 MAG: hypothetical protein KIT02_02880 [Devosia sp.]